MRRFIKRIGTKKLNKDHFRPCYQRKHDLTALNAIQIQSCTAGIASQERHGPVLKTPKVLCKESVAVYYRMTSYVSLY